MRSVFAALAALSLLSGCTAPPASDYVAGTPMGAQDQGLSLGTNAGGEQCTQRAAGGAQNASVYCGSWQEPAARVHADGASGAVSLMQMATTGAWRDGIEQRFVCDAPTTTSILNGDPAVILQCKRRIGGWPQVALVASANGRIYQADGILPTLSVIERSIGVLSGQVSASAAPALPPSAADTQLASQLAAHAFTASDVGEYQRLMAVGARANLAENFAAAEIAYRAALALQQRLLGKDNPDTVTALMHLALQVSDQGRFAEADALFKQAELLAPRASDKAATARLRHYQALNALNQHHDDQALALLDTAATGYTALVPRESLQEDTEPPSAAHVASLDITLNQRLMTDPTEQSALMGLIEVRRYQSIVLRQLGKPAESAVAIAQAQMLARTNRLAVPLVAARLVRTSATSDDARGNVIAAADGFAASRVNFAQVVPQTRPLAETMLLQAGVAARQNDTPRAIGLCRTATALLRELKSGTQPVLLEPCLSAFAAEAAHQPGDRQVLLGQMFETAQLAQDTVTSREIDEAAARLAAGARDPKVGQAIRRRQDAADNLADLYRQRDAIAAGNGSSGVTNNPATLDSDIVKAQTELTDADGALQAAAPNYGQLVQQVVPAADVLSALRNDEALAAITLTEHGGWIFLLRNGAINVAPMRGDSASITALVKRIRASIEPTTEAMPQFDTHSAQALYDAALSPVASQLQGTKALVVVPVGP
jgi:hypothetical protein